MLLKADRSAALKSGKRKPFTKWTERDCTNLLNSIENQNSKNSAGITLKTFMKSIGKGKVMENWTPKQSFSMLPDMVPTDEEIQAILKAMDDTKFRSFFHVLADSGARVGSILGLKKHQVGSFDKYGVIITLPTSKTGAGLRLRLVSSAPCLREWLNVCPSAPEGQVWNVSYDSVNRRFHTAVKKAGIQKAFTIHGLRHARATQLTRAGMTEQLMRQQFGWRPGSRMTEKYVHLVGKDLDEAVLKANGIELPREAISVGLKPIICPICKTPNDPTWSFCVKCSASLTGASASVDELIGVLHKVLDSSNLEKELDSLIKKDIEKAMEKQSNWLAEEEPESLNKFREIFEKLMLIYETTEKLDNKIVKMGKTVALGLRVLDQGAKKLDAEAASSVSSQKA
jgi:integrase